MYDFYRSESSVRLYRTADFFHGKALSSPCMSIERLVIELLQLTNVSAAKFLFRLWQTWPIRWVFPGKLFYAFEHDVSFAPKKEKPSA